MEAKEAKVISTIQVTSIEKPEHLSSNFVWAVRHAQTIWQTEFLSLCLGSNAYNLWMGNEGIRVRSLPRRGATSIPNKFDVCHYGRSLVHR